METPANDLARLGKYGIVGVMLALVGALVFTVYCIFSLAVGTISETNKINTALTSAVTELSTIIKLPNRITKNGY